MFGAQGTFKANIADSLYLLFPEEVLASRAAATEASSCVLIRDCNEQLV
jgi:hypothetical protein